MLLIALCFAETGSYFSGTGGPYFICTLGLRKFCRVRGGMDDLVRTGYILGCTCKRIRNQTHPFLPTSLHDQPWLSPVIVTLIIVGLTIPNIFGAQFGAKLSSVFTAAKLIPIIVFIAVGIFYIDTSKFTPFAPNGYEQFGESTVTLLYAYVGFEVLAVPAGEMKNPKRAIPIALLTVLLLCSFVYFLIMAVTFGTLDNVAGSANAVEDASRVFMGPMGGTLIAVGIAVSIFGVNAGSALITPRCLYALAENKQMPSVFAKLHPKYQTPVVAIVVSAVISLALGLSGSFKQLAVISVVARFSQYIPTCLAIFVLKKQSVPGFVLPGGLAIPAAALALSFFILAQAKSEQLIAGLIAIIIGIPVYFFPRNKAVRAKRRV